MSARRDAPGRGPAPSDGAPRIAAPVSRPRPVVVLAVVALAIVALAIVAILASLLVGAVATVSAGSFDDGKAGFRLRFRDEISPYRVIGMFVMPGEEIELAAEGGAAGDTFTCEATAGVVTRETPAAWSWRAPRRTGLHPLRVIRVTPADTILVNAFVMVPFSAIKDGMLDGYRIGTYPRPRPGRAHLDAPPRGFIEVDAFTAEVRIAPHFRLGQFVCKQAAEGKRYVVLRERLPLKLELLLGQVNARGFRCDTFAIMSGYRTPDYNRAIGNVAYSRHLWGGAADIYIDHAPEDGRMDDLDGDGRSDARDARVLHDLIDANGDQPWYRRFIGGLARYRPNSKHGPFVHVDVRGTRARWNE